MIYRVYKPAPELADIVEYYWYSKFQITSSTDQHYPTPVLQGLGFNFHEKEEQNSFKVYNYVPALKNISEYSWYPKTQTTTAVIQISPASSFLDTQFDFLKREEQYPIKAVVTNLSTQAYFFGQQTSPRVISAKEKGVDILCVKFKPLGIVKVTGINMEHLTDSIIPAGDIWGNEVELLYEKMQSMVNIEERIKLLEKFLYRSFLAIRQAYYLQNVSNALSLINGSNGAISVSNLYHKSNTTKKTLQRNFLHCLGVTPKLYTQIVRFNSIKKELDNILIKHKLYELAYDYGYYNSSHFASEFRRFSGLSPTEYLKSNSI